MKKFLSVTLSLLLAASMPLSALAESYDLAQGSITVNAESGGQTVRQGGGAAVPDSAPVITGTSKENTVTINAEKDQTANVTLSGANIDVSSAGKAAVSTTGEGNVNIELNGSNALKSGHSHAGLEKNNDGNLTIQDKDKDGSLNAKGGQDGAGIGGGSSGAGSDITITGGKVTARGGNYGAGIGGGAYGNGSDITVTGGEVTANSGNYGAGIGGGGWGNGNNISISGGKVTATGGTFAAGIGGGMHRDGNDITISGGEVSAAGGRCGAGIGGGLDARGSGDVTVSGDAKLKVRGGKTGDDGQGAGIGNGGVRDQNGPVNGTEVEPDICALNPSGKIEYYAPGSVMTGTPSKTVTNPTGDFVWDSGTVTTPATCTGKGVRTYTCTSSSHTKTEDIPALNHSFAGREYVSDNNATCEQDGTKTAKCVRYGQGGCTATDTVTDVGSKLGHDFEAKDYVSNGDATCEQDGTKTAKCVRYGQGGCTATDTVTDVGSKLGHDFEAKDYVSNGDATCEQDGTKTAKCVRYGQGGCSATDTVTDVGSKLGHDFEAKDYVSNGDATCEQDGTKTAKCVRYGQGGCTATNTVTDTGSKLGHDFTDYIYNDNASYTEDGTETAHCNHAGCNETHTRKAEGTRWALFQVKDEKGWYVTYAESRSGSVLTITVNQSVATLSGTIAGLRVLQASGITTVIFKTTEAESTFHIADLLSGTSYNLTHKNTAVNFTLDGSDVVTLLK